MPSETVTLDSSSDAMRMESCLQETVIRDFLFADDYALNAGTEPEMQNSMTKFSAACNNFGLTFSIKKTEVMHQPARGQIYTPPKILVKNQPLPNKQICLPAWNTRLDGPVTVYDGW